MEIKFVVVFLLAGFTLVSSTDTFGQQVGSAVYATPFSPTAPSSLGTLQDSRDAFIDKTTFVVRDIFQLKFGHYRDAISLIDEAMKLKFFPAGTTRVLTDFTGNAYRLILEGGYNSLNEYEKSLSSELNAEQWKSWYEQFKLHVESSSREILRWVR